jgi:hypothetical protein
MLDAAATHTPSARLIKFVIPCHACHIKLTIAAKVTATSFGMTTDEVISGGLDNDVKVRITMTAVVNRPAP